MGMSAKAYLAYGYSLTKSHDEWAIREADEWGTPNVAWWDAEAEDPESFATALIRRMEASRGEDHDWLTDETIRALGVDLLSYNHHEYPMYALVVAPYHRCYTGEAETLTAADLGVSEAWPVNLTHALQILGVTPVQTEPAWLLVPDYG